MGDQHFVDIDAQLAGIDRVERVFGVDIGGDATLFLGFGHGMERQGGLARGFRAVNFDHAAARQAADAERDVQAERAGGHRLDLDLALGAQLHHRALAESPIDLGKRRFKRAFPLPVVPSHHV